MMKKIVSALKAFERGEIVVVTDDDDRENEGDLTVAAVHCTEEKMAFILRHTTGIVCTPMPKKKHNGLILLLWYQIITLHMGHNLLLLWILNMG